MGISTHVLDTSRGRPAAGIEVRLERREGTAWVVAGEGTTDADGRVRSLLPGDASPGTYRLRFEIAPYFADLGQPAFFPVVEVAFSVSTAGERVHVPLLVSPYAYSTYRGS